ncbi:MAG: YciI family protein [Blastocatellia bacterium]
MSNFQLGMRMRARLRGLITATVVLCLSTAIFPAAAANPQDPKFEMGTFYLCLLVKPANWSGLKPETQQIFQEHVKHVQSLIASGKAAIAGPFGDDTRIAGVFVLNASSAEEARAWEEADPLVKSGGFTVEVLKWWAAKGIMKPPPQPMAMATYYFAFLRRGPKWTGQRTPETDKLQADHMAHINSMARSGKLVIAGPFENAGEYAGVFVFKVDSIDEARALAEADPTVKTGRLTIDVHPWMVPKGSLP